MTYSDIKSKFYLLTKTNSTSFTDANLVILANNALDRVVSLILRSDGRWQFDDTNQTDLPIATTALVSGQADYSLTTSHLAITRVEVQDQNSKWWPLEPLDLTDNTEISFTTAFGSGTPQYYDISGTTVFLYPTPNYSQSASLKIWFKRLPSYFVSSDTTKAPGFNGLYHDLIPLWAAYEYAMINLPQLAPSYLAEIQRKEAELVADYGRRNENDRPRITTRPIWFR